MSTGTVKFFNESKGFGFITPEEGGNDVFVHSSEIVDGPLYENDKVTFEIGEGQKGPCAIKVSKI
ncbi:MULTISPECIES: cold-shock protein [unclassified Oceanispirochaeta]|uniref:cold-shock protein n=1 Tax=unclassified Oceanispirochaeta TaxID=2635722 RepID=UPI000E09C701|nr:MULTISPECIES: cold-shock protein [unclassified Oceanispirochaeta]MBF9014653.1 cold-shock protein [Oceanispirochaeta sp. M2]NPD70909.1 cold-shock protein [Oceanispirochaeta sp. M1]RDG33745.1 cold-shock protein [Oceanispirochaeta sp. M1]